ncbi:paraneoplastic antigen Ma3-like [Mya arenaria]|uniref:paraneoplastic antigen Ma3-like n=1 Tax=Mya arenaria TaxID=6604 RepID=UPI0022E2B8A4|nr:paraneoplastic antigen Ma3-like [Mya arenaria]
MAEAEGGGYDFDVSARPKSTPLRSFIGESQFPKGRGGVLQMLSETRPGNSTQVVNMSPFIPKLPFFSGDEPVPKTECTFVEWRYEVKCLISEPDIHEHYLLQAIRRSVRGTARRLLIPLGENATVTDILEKLDAMFGDVSTHGMIMQEFFNAIQRVDENVTSFACRLETLLQTAIENGHMSPQSKNDLLRHKFWTSLNSETLKGQTRHKYDTLSDFNSLFREIRTVEKEISLTTEGADMDNIGVEAEALDRISQKSNLFCCGPYRGW